ncbi:unnamed protein product [Gadus morhua 'NCC']
MQLLMDSESKGKPNKQGKDEEETIEQATEVSKHWTGSHGPVHQDQITRTEHQDRNNQDRNNQDRNNQDRNNSTEHQDRNNQDRNNQDRNNRTKQQY